MCNNILYNIDIIIVSVMIQRKYVWNERNLMQESSENRLSVYYRYGADGQRAVKSSNQSETPKSPTACKAGTPIQRRYRTWQKVGEFLQTHHTAV